jgi:hypothetical protein
MTDENIDYSGQIGQLLKEWKAVFYALCDDGIHRPVFICPTDVVGLKSHLPPIQIGNGLAFTSITCRDTDIFSGKEPHDILVYEQIATVLSTLGSQFVTRMDIMRCYLPTTDYINQPGFCCPPGM